ncbi:MAG: hypothetical protein ACREJO_04705 [Phycisphaerales bacterium]
MALGRLISEWTARLLGVRKLLRKPAPDTDGWLLRIRERVLTFLVARYGTKQDVLRAEPWGPELFEDEPTQFTDYLPLLEPEVADAPPRRRQVLAEPLRNIRQINEDKRPRWRLWL